MRLQRRTNLYCFNHGHKLCFTKMQKVQARICNKYRHRYVCKKHVMYSRACLPSTTRGVVQCIFGGRAVNAIFSDCIRRVVSVPQSLKGFQVLRTDVTGSSVIKMNWIRIGIRMLPSITLESRQPVGVVRGVDGTATLMIGSTRHSS